MGGVFVFGEPLAELTEVRPGSAMLGVGGDTFNTAVYLGRGGVSVSMVTALGTDPMSAEVARLMAEEGLSAGHVLRNQARPVGLYAIETDADGERSFTYWRSGSAFRAWFGHPGAEAALTAMASADLLYLSGITLSAFGPENRERITALAHAVRQRGGQVAFDPNYRPAGWEDAETAREAIGALMSAVSIALPTFEDEAALFGHAQPEDSLSAWQDAGAAEVCVKCGPKGALLSGHGWVAPAAVRQPLDTTGAGDSFNGAYLAAHLSGTDPLHAARAGNALAGEVIMVRGAIIPNVPERAAALA